MLRLRVFERRAIPVQATITTADGVLAVMDGIGTAVEGLVFTDLDVVVAAEDIGGTFGEQMFRDERGPLRFDSVGFSFQFDLETRALRDVSVYAVDGAVLATGDSP